MIWSKHLYRSSAPPTKGWLWRMQFSISNAVKYHASSAEACLRPANISSVTHSEDQCLRSCNLIRAQILFKAGVTSRIRYENAEVEFSAFLASKWAAECKEIEGQEAPCSIKLSKWTNQVMASTGKSLKSSGWKKSRLGAQADNWAAQAMNESTAMFLIGCSSDRKRHLL